MASSRFRLTIRHGHQVSKRDESEVDAALAVLAESVRSVRREGALEPVSMIRRFEPEARVAARIEISTGGLLRRRDAGVDVMGDGTLIAFTGGVGRHEAWRGTEIESALEVVREAIGGAR